MKIDLDNLDAFCWSKMGTEAGQTLDKIINRKEIERIANSGVFTWGIGNSLGDAVDLLINECKDPIAVFTPMKSKPKAIDISPGAVLLWIGYYNKNGKVRRLPDYSFLTSRGNSEKQLKKNHYALICHSSQPITKSSGGQLDSSRLVNIKSRKPVGASQVTAVVRNLKKPQEGRSPSIYDIGFVANLYAEGHVKLALPVEITQTDVDALMLAAKKGDVGGWKSILSELKSIHQ